jgi:hypothetical protein
MKKFIINTNSKRERFMTDFNNIIPKSLQKILLPQNPVLQFQYNDINNDVIGRSPILKFYKNFNSKIFIPKIDNDLLKIPNNAHSILIFGLIVKFRSIKSVNNYFTKYNKYKPTQGIDITNIYLPRPHKHFISQFNLESGDRNFFVKRDDINYEYAYNDIIDSIEFKDNKLHKINTIESIVQIG